MFIVCVISGISLLLFYNYHWKRRNLPPGPAPLPLLGNVLTLAKEERWESKFCEWSRAYGSTFTYWLGEMPVVAVCDYHDMRRYFVKHSELFSERMDLKVWMELSRGGAYGIVITNGDSWSAHRRFALKTLRDFGLGKNQMEERIITELHSLLDRVNGALPTDEIHFSRYSDLAVGSIINAIMCGYSFSGTNEDEFDRLKNCAIEATRAVSTASASLVFMSPRLMSVPILNAQAKIGVDRTKEMIAHFDRQIEKHLRENAYTEDLEPTDFLDAFLVERQKQMRNNGNEGHFSLNELRSVCFDIWTAGQETTSETITWTIAYLISYPDVQKKLQKELDTVIGSNRIIRNSDRPDLPYTNAVVMEAQRCGNILSQNLPRAVTKDVKMDGFLYKKGTVVIPQISVLLQDPKVFPEPAKFNPDRFIDQNGRLKQVEELIPFSIGKRICLGEGMARMELFIFTANLFNQYKFEAGRVAPSLKKESGASSKILPYNCRIELRK